MFSWPSSGSLAVLGGLEPPTFSLESRYVSREKSRHIRVPRTSYLVGPEGGDSRLRFVSGIAPPDPLFTTPAVTAPSTLFVAPFMLNVFWIFCLMGTGIPGGCCDSLFLLFLLILSCQFCAIIRSDNCPCTGG